MTARRPPSLDDLARYPRMTGWFQPMLLARMLRRMLISETFGHYADRRLLVAALDEVIYRLDAAGELVLAADVAARDGDRLRLRLTVGDARRAEATGAVPKAASLHGLSFAERHGTWACAVTVDV